MGSDKKKTRKVRNLSSQFPGESQCHPRIKNKSGGCLPEDVYQKAGKRLGISSIEVINSKGGGKQTRKSKSKKAKLVSQLYKTLKVKEGNERSLLKKLPIPQEEKEKIAKEYLRPEMPSSWNEKLYSETNWLDSSNIRDVMKQYEEAYPHFKFLGPYPIDFAAPNPYTRSGEKRMNLNYKNPPPAIIGIPDPLKAGQCLIGDMCGLDLKKEAANGKTGIGIVYNLDPHYKDGSHWMASYIDIPKKEFYFFDSYGMRPPRPIYKFMQWLTLQEPNMKLGWNGRRFQRRDSECGMYCLYFLAKMISGQPFLEFVRSDPPDSLMMDLRDWIYST